MPAGTVTLSGTAAGGAPLIGTITVKDSTNFERAKTIDLAAAGQYSIDVTGLKPPFLLRAEGTIGGTSVTYFSGATSDDLGKTINITPFTDLIIGNIAGQLAKDFYKSPNFAMLTTGKLNEERDRLKGRLTDVLKGLGVDDSVDLLRSSFKADHTGLDQVLDIVRVTPPGQGQGTIAKIKNLANEQEIEDDLASHETTPLPAINTTKETASNLQQITDVGKALENLLATSIPRADNAQLLALFDTRKFLENGDKFDEFASSSIQPEVLGAKFTFSLVSLTPSDAPTTAKIKLTFSPVNGIPSTEEWQLNKDTINTVSAWRLIGNQRIAGPEVEALASNFQETISGLSFLAIDIPPGSTIDYAVVTGTTLAGKGGRDGLSPGLLLVNYRNGASMGVAQPPYKGATEALTPPRAKARYNVLPLTDVEIQTMQDNEVYTVIFFDDNNTPTDFSDDVALNDSGYTTTLPKRPYLLTELPSAFPTFTSPTRNQLDTVALNGGNLNIVWTLPAGQLAARFEFGRGTVPTIGGGNTTFDSVHGDLTTTALSTSITVAPPGSGQTVQSAHLSLETQDSSGRRFQIFLP